MVEDELIDIVFNVWMDMFYMICVGVIFIKILWCEWFFVVWLYYFYFVCYEFFWDIVGICEEFFIVVIVYWWLLLIIGDVNVLFV